MEEEGEEFSPSPLLLIGVRKKIIQNPFEGWRCCLYLLSLRETSAWPAEEELINKGEGVSTCGSSLPPLSRSLSPPPRVCVHAQTHATSRAHPSDRQQACVCIVCLWNINEANTHSLVHAGASEVRE